MEPKIISAWCSIHGAYNCRHVTGWPLVRHTRAAPSSHAAIVALSESPKFLSPAPSGAFFEALFPRNSNHIRKSPLLTVRTSRRSDHRIFSVVQGSSDGQEREQVARRIQMLMGIGGALPPRCSGKSCSHKVRPYTLLCIYKSSKQIGNLPCGMC